MSDYLEQRAYYNPAKDVLCISPDISCATQQINEIVDILWANNPYPSGNKLAFVGFALQGVRYFLTQNKIQLLKSEVPVSLILDLFIKKYGMDILGKHKEKIYALLEKDLVVYITT